MACETEDCKLHTRSPAINTQLEALMLGSFCERAKALTSSRGSHGSLQVALLRANFRESKVSVVARLSKSRSQRLSPRLLSELQTEDRFGGFRDLQIEF